MNSDAVYYRLIPALILIMTLSFSVYQVIMGQFTSLLLRIQRKTNSQGKNDKIVVKLQYFNLTMVVVLTLLISLNFH